MPPRCATSCASTLPALYNLSSGTDFSILQDQVDAAGQRFVRLQQLKDGVPVPQGQISVHVGADGALLAVLGQLVAQVQAQQPSLGDGQKIVQAAISPLTSDGLVTSTARSRPRSSCPRAAMPSWPCAPPSSTPPTPKPAEALLLKSYSSGRRMARSWAATARFTMR